MNEIGTTREEMETPALLIDLDLMEQNIATMAAFFRGEKSSLRAHTKVHKSPELAKIQITSGAIGICCQKVGGAEIMASAGIEDILITNVVATPSKIDRLVKLSKQTGITVEIDDFSNAEQISRAATKQGTVVNALVDVQIGSKRFGAPPGEPAVKLAQKIRELGGIRLKGLMGVDSHLGGVEPRTTRKDEIEKAEGQLIETKKLFEKSGLPVEIVSVGATGTYDVSGSNPDVTEVQAGSYLLMDANYRKHVPEFACAMSLLTTATSKLPEGIVVLDAGRSSMSAINGPPELVSAEDFDPSNFEYYQMHSENSLLKLRSNSAKINTGDKVQLIPSYLDATIVRHDRFYGMRNGRVEKIFPIQTVNAST